MKETLVDTRSVDTTHSIDDVPLKVESSFMGFNPEEEKLLTEIRTDLDSMKRKETAMEALLQDLLAANKETYAALASHSSLSTQAAP